MPHAVEMVGASMEADAVPPLVEQSAVGMTGALEALPEFADPPVVEVILAVGFEPAYQLSNIALMEAWRDLFKERFPVAAEQPYYAMPIEKFGIQIPKMELVTSQGPPPVRLWLTTDDSAELIQLQHNWFARNWRKVESGGEYPRYENHIRPAFERDLNIFAAYARNQEIDPQYIQCEITYINHIPVNKLWDKHGDIVRLFQIIDKVDHLTSPLESIAFRSSSIIHNSSNEYAGRLYMEIESVYDFNGQPTIRFNLVARGAPIAGKNRDAVIRFFDLGRDRIVRCFAEVTSKEIHQEWRRTR